MQRNQYVANSGLHIDDQRTGFEEQALENAFQDAPFYQLPQPNLIANPVPHYITLHSGHRDRTRYPSTSNYRIDFTADNARQLGAPGTRYKNVVSVKLLSASVPKRNGVLDEPYLLLHFDELQGMYDAPSTACARAFTKLFLKFQFGNFLKLDRGVGDPLELVFWPTPLASLDHLTVSFRRYDGSLFDFGTDTPDGEPVDPELQTQFTLEIRTAVPDAYSALGHRNV